MIKLNFGRLMIMAENNGMDCMDEEEEDAFGLNIIEWTDNSKCGCMKLKAYKKSLVGEEICTGDFASDALVTLAIQPSTACPSTPDFLSKICCANEMTAKSASAVTHLLSHINGAHFEEISLDSEINTRLTSTIYAKKLLLSCDLLEISFYRMSLREILDNCMRWIAAKRVRVETSTDMLDDPYLQVDFRWRDYDHLLEYVACGRGICSEKLEIRLMLPIAFVDELIKHLKSVPSFEHAIPWIVFKVHEEEYTCPDYPQAYVHERNIPTSNWTERVSQADQQETIEIPSRKAYFEVNGKPQHQQKYTFNFHNDNCSANFQLFLYSVDIEEGVDRVEFKIVGE